jgi:hypothetical protein
LLQATVKRKTKAIGCLKVELVEEIAVLLRQSIQVCMTEASHERNLIRAALIELVELYGGTQLENETENQRKTHMQAAFYYLNLALTIQAQQTFIMETFELQNATAPASMANNLDKLPVFITNELFPRSGSSGSIPIVVDSVALVNYFLRVQKEKNLLPIGLNDFQNEIAHILHVFFLQNHPLYLKQCCLQVLGQVPKEDPQLSAGFILLHYGKNICPVLVQAQEKQQDKTCEIPPKGSKIAFDNTVNVYFTLGTTALPEGGHNVNNEPSNTRLKVFAATPYLSKRNGLDSKKLKEFKQRLSQLRIEIEDSQDGSLLVPKAQPFASIQVFEKVFVEILRDIQVFFASSSSSTRVSSTTNCTTSSTSLVDTYGNTFMVPCTVETVSIVEKICQCDDGGAGNGGGIQTIEKSICYFLRDLFEQMGE